MSKKKKEPEVVIEVEILEEEIELDEEVINQFGKELQSSIEFVVNDNITKDTRIELVNVLLSIAAQVSIDVGIGDGEFLGMADYFYEEGQKIADEDEVDLSKLN
jgi:hypothetical protein